MEFHTNNIEKTTGNIRFTAKGKFEIKIQSE